MHTRIKVLDLTLRQWQYIADNVPDEQVMTDSTVRVSVCFELGPYLERHVEMPVRHFISLITQLVLIEREALVKAALTPDDHQPYLDEAEAVVSRVTEVYKS